jgi:endonuclease YncB( thermonuclease family)
MFVARRLVVALLAVGLFAAGLGAAAEASRTGSGPRLPAAGSKTCPSGYVLANLSWGEKCLHDGEFCKVGNLEYHAYGFDCPADGRLTDYYGTSTSATTTTPPATTTSTTATTTTKSTTTTPAPAASASLARVDHVADGDTVDLTNGARVRLVQIDTPEVYFGDECFGPQASAETKRLLPPGTLVRLTREPATDSVDSYGRLLRYAIRVRDGLNVNVRLVGVGAAAPYFFDGRRGRYATTLERLALRARRLHLGLWGRCPGTPYQPNRSSRPDVRVDAPLQRAQFYAVCT